MTPIERAATIIDREYGPCNDDVNHRGTEAHYAAEALAEAGLLLTDEDRAVLEAAEAQEARHEDAGWSRGLFTENTCPCDVCSAVRVRREALETADPSPSTGAPSDSLTTEEPSHHSPGQVFRHGEGQHDFHPITQYKEP